MNETCADNDELTQARQANAAAQLVEHVDEHGEVIEIVSRAEMRERSLRHRSVYIAVIDSHDRLLCHKRADWKDVFPGAWDLAFGGVCDVGEDWLPSAHRELQEEAGIQGDLVDCGPVTFDAPGVALVGRLYACRHEGPFTFDDGEVVDTKWVPLAELAGFVASTTVPDDSAVLITHQALRDALPTISVEESPS